jgi:MFS family permease
MSLLHGPRLLILILLVSLASVAGVLFTPALPSLTKEFGIPQATAQWSMTIFLFAYCLGQLPYGPLSNRFGRKKALFIGLDIALAGSLLCLFSNSFWLFCIGRFLQAIGAAAGLKVVFTMIADQHQSADATKTFSYVMMAFAVMPGIGVAIGGYLTVYFGWKGCFAFLALYTLVLSFLVRLLPETAKSLHKDALQMDKIVHGLRRQFKDPFLIWHSLLMGLGTSIIYIFATVAPYLGIVEMGLTPDAYGLWALLPPLGISIGLFFTARLSYQITPRVGMLSGILLSFVGVIVLAALFNVKWIVPATLFLPMVLIQTGFGLSFTFATSKALSEATDKSNASAVMQFTNMGIVAIATLVTGLCMPVGAAALAAVFGLIVILECAVWLKLKAHH